MNDLHIPLLRQQYCIFGFDTYILFVIEIEGQQEQFFTGIYSKNDTGVLHIFQSLFALKNQKNSILEHIYTQNKTIMT